MYSKLKTHLKLYNLNHRMKHLLKINLDLKMKLFENIKYLFLKPNALKMLSERPSTIRGDSVRSK
jgi:hypothetical protein